MTASDKNPGGVDAAGGRIASTETPVSGCSEFADAAQLPVRIKGDALRRSLYFCTLGWVFGAFWSAATTGATITRFTEYLAPAHEKDLVLAFVFAAPAIGVVFQIPGAFVIEHLGRRKGFFITWMTVMRVIYLLVGLLPWFFPQASASGAWLFVGMLIVAWFFGQFGGQAWVNWMADMVPPRVRGKYFGRRLRMGIAVMVCTCMMMAVLLDASGKESFLKYVKPWSDHFGMTPLVMLISILILAAGVSGIIDIQIFHKVDEPRMSQQSTEPIWRRLVNPFKDWEFRRYVTYLSLFNFAQGFCAPFWWAYLLLFLDTLRAEHATNWWLNYYYIAAYLMLTVGYQMGQFIGYPVWGIIFDRFGRKPIIFLSSFCHTFSWMFWLFLTPAMLPWAVLAQIIGGFFGSGQEIANFNMMLGFNRKGGAGYQAVATVIVSLSAALAGVLAGLLANGLQPFDNRPDHPYVFTLLGMDFNRYRVVIIIGIVVKMFGDLVMLARVHDFASKPTGHAVRYLIENVYGNFDSVILSPIRKFPVATAGAVRRINGVAGDAADSMRRIFRSDD